MAPSISSNTSLKIVFDIRGVGGNAFVKRQNFLRRKLLGIPRRTILAIERHVKIVNKLLATRGRSDTEEIQNRRYRRRGARRLPDAPADKQAETVVTASGV